jgi:hypothetical protein
VDGDHGHTPCHTHLTLTHLFPTMLPHYMTQPAHPASGHTQSATETLWLTFPTTLACLPPRVVVLIKAKRKRTLSNSPRWRRWLLPPPPTYACGRIGRRRCPLVHHELCRGDIVPCLPL